MLLYRVLIAFSLIISLFFGCTRKSEYSSELDLGNRKVNYLDDIQPIFEGKCLECHGSPPRKGAPEGSQYTSFNDVVLMSEDIFAHMIDLTMPPPEENNPLTPTEIKLMKVWIETAYFLIKEAFGLLFFVFGRPFGPAFFFFGTNMDIVN